MPLVTPQSGGLGIEIPITSDSKQFIDTVDRVNKKLKDLEGLAKENAALASKVSQSQTQAAKTATMSWTDFRSAYQVALDVVRVGQQVWAATGGEFVKYAEQVKNLSRNIGVSAEDASRLIQIGDDVRISYESMSTAMKIAQKQGIDVSIDGLTKLADKYKSLAPGVERTQFLMKTFGRSGLEMGKLLEQGGAGVTRMSAEVEKALVLTDESIKKSDEYQRSVYTLSDSFLALKISVGNYLVGPATDLLNDERDHIRAREILAEQGKNWLFTSNKEDLAALALAKSEREASDAAFLLKDGIEGVTGSADENEKALTSQKAAVEAAGKAFDDYKKMLDEVSQANQDAESFIQSYADSQKDYEKDHADAVDKVREAEEKLAKVQAEKKGKGRGEAIAEATAGIAEAQKGVQELEATWHEATQAMIYDMVLAKVSVDGLTDAEFKATQDVAVQMGIRTQAQADEAKAMMDKANSIVDGIALQEDVVREKMQTDANLLQLENDKKAAADGTTAAIVQGATVGSAALGGLDGAIRSNISNMDALGASAARTASIIQQVSINSSGNKTIRPAATTTTKPVYKGGGLSPDERDSGGPGFAGQTYMIGTGAQPEMFTPATNGTFTPNADKKGGGGVTYNIVVNNPKKETAEDSIRRNLKSLSYNSTVAA